MFKFTFIKLKSGVRHSVTPCTYSDDKIEFALTCNKCKEKAIHSNIVHPPVLDKNYDSDSNDVEIIEYNNVEDASLTETVYKVAEETEKSDAFVNANDHVFVKHIANSFSVCIKGCGC